MSSVNMRLTLALTLLTTTALAQTPAALTEQHNLCVLHEPFPPMPTFTSPVPLSATSGKPQIDQIRAGKIVATYSTFADGPGCTMKGDGTDWQNPAPAAQSGCGPFTREHHYRLWAAHDTFVVHPAVYSGLLNQPWIGPTMDSNAAYAAGQFTVPSDIMIRGMLAKDGSQPVIVQDGALSDNTLSQAPVYIDTSNGITFDHITIACTQAPCPNGKAGLYNVGGSNFTMSYVRVTGFAPANGIMGGKMYTGWWRIAYSELDHDGGTNSADDHNAYIGASNTVAAAPGVAAFTGDPNYTIVLAHSFLHDAFYGHLVQDPRPGRPHPRQHLPGRPAGPAEHPGRGV